MAEADARSLTAWKIPFAAKLAACGFSVKPPIDLDTVNDSSGDSRRASPSAVFSDRGFFECRGTVGKRCRFRSQPGLASFRGWVRGGR
jgi:hypothetical protein